MTPFAAITDEDLMETYYQSADPKEANEAFAELERRYRTRLVLSLTLAGYHRGFVKLPRMPGRNEKADELANETLFKAADTRGRPSAHFQRSRRTFHAWLFGILHNVAVSFLRRRQPGVCSTDAGPEIIGEQPGAPEEVLAREPSPQEEMQHRAVLEGMAACLAELPAELRQLCDLIFARSMKQTEVAKVMGLSTPTLTRRKKEACRQLNACLRRKGITADLLT